MLEKVDKEALFGSLTAAEREQWLQQAIRRTYGKGQIFVARGEVWPYLFLVDSGEVHAEKQSVEGRRLQVLVVEPGDVFWGLAFFYNEAPMPVTLQAAQRSTLYLWNRERLLPLLLDNSHVLWQLARVMVGRMNRASEIVEDLAFHPVASRLAGLLLEEYATVDAGPVKRDLTLDEMAARIGTTREVVCRVLYRFSDDDLIEITRTEFVLNDTDGLAQLAGRKG